MCQILDSVSYHMLKYKQLYLLSLEAFNSPKYIKNQYVLNMNTQSTKEENRSKYLHN